MNAARYSLVADIQDVDCWLSNGLSFSRYPFVPKSLKLHTGAPRCDLLDQPHIAVGISEGEERPVAIALGVGAGKPSLQGKRCAVPHLTRVDATAAEFAMIRPELGDKQLPRARAPRRRSELQAERHPPPC